MKRLVIISTALLAIALGGCAMSVDDPDALSSWSDGQYMQRGPSTGTIDNPDTTQAEFRTPVIASGVNPNGASRPTDQAGKPQPQPYVPGNEQEPPCVGN